MKLIEPKVLPHKITDWLKDYDKMLVFFTAKDIEEAISKSPYVDYTSYKVTTTEYFEHPPTYKTILFERTENQTPRQKISYYQQNGRTVQKITNSWEYRLPSEYQGDINEFIITYCLNKLLPFFRDFKWAIYSIGYGPVESYEIYLKTGYMDDLWGNELSLYVPLKALLSNDWKAIETRNTKYWNSYCNPSESKWNNADKTHQQYYDAMMEVFKTPDVKLLKKVLTIKSKLE